MPGKGKGGKGKGKGKEVIHAQAPPAPVPPAKWSDEADRALVDIIFRLGDFRIHNWNDIHHEFQEVQGFPNTKNACQSRWSREHRVQFHDYVKALGSQPYHLPQVLTYDDEEEDKSCMYPPPVTPGGESSRMGAQRARPTAPTAATSHSSALPSTPHRLHATPEDGEVGHTGMDTEYETIYLYSGDQQPMGKIAVKNGFRIIEIRDTLQTSLPMTFPVAAWPVETNSHNTPQQPDDSHIDRRLFMSIESDENPLHPEADNDAFDKSGAPNPESAESQQE